MERAWQKPVYFGKHERRWPATGAKPYLYDPARNGNRFTRASIWNWSERTSWTQSPQAQFWLDRPKRTLLERFRDWLDK